MAGDEQEREGDGSSPGRKPSNGFVRAKFNKVEKSAGLTGRGIAAFAAGRTTASTVTRSIAG